jgi:hypothetical protein
MSVHGLQKAMAMPDMWKCDAYVKKTKSEYRLEIQAYGSSSNAKPGST